MIIPVRCFTCGAVVGDKWEDFAKAVEEGENPREVLDRLRVKRYCCRRMITSHVNILDEILRFHNPSNGRKENLE